MARLIDADDFLKRLNERPVDYIDPGCDFYYFEETVQSVLNETPTVDAVPVVQGRWEWLGPYRGVDDGWIGTCSVCKQRVRFFEKDYCPNCGAKMDLEVE